MGFAKPEAVRSSFGRACLGGSSAIFTSSLSSSDHGWKADAFVLGAFSVGFVAEGVQPAGFMGLSISDASGMNGLVCVGNGLQGMTVNSCAMCTQTK